MRDAEQPPTPADVAERAERIRRTDLGLYVTEFFAEAFPLTPDHYMAAGGQVRGASGRKVTAILAGHDETRNVRGEGGRTSRGSVRYVQSLADVINTAGAAAGVDAFNSALRRAFVWLLQDWFVDRVRDDSQRLAEILRDDDKDDVLATVARLFGSEITSQHWRRPEMPITVHGGGGYAALILKGGGICLIVAGIATVDDGAVRSLAG
ncbi:DUF4928 family protein [Nocardia sp. KC 131]|uniref:DUF4928 family protein n=1 Tax=Nocardia arseniciresistens TaxID=3392119 RepID=UPI00398F3665